MTVNDKPKMNMKHSGAGLAIAIVLIGVSFFVGKHLGGKSQQAPAMNPMAAMANAVVSVSAAPATMDFIDNPREYVGYVEAVESVDLQSQVSGYIETVHFSEGAFVKEGDLLFTIEQSQYQATLQLRQAELTQAQADLAQSEKYLARLTSADNRSVSQNDIDTAESSVLGNKAKVQQCKANIELAKIDLDHTVIKAPIDGYIGKAIVTEGNYVSTATGLLARIVQWDPVRVLFSLADKEYLEAVKDFKSPDGPQIAVRLKLSDGSEYPLEGQRDFENNEMDPKTATIAIRFRFDNTDKILVPGEYVTVLLGQAERQKSLVVPHSAILNTAEGTGVYIVDADSKAQLRPVVIGDQTEKGVVIVSGLTEGQTIITEGLQKVRPGATVKVNP